MALANAAKRVSAEFDYPAEDLNKAVKEFLREMGGSAATTCENQVAERVS